VSLVIGEVSGLNSSALARIWPPPGATDVESNYFPIVEIVPADLPWQYTSSAPDATYNRLRPWLCLIVLEDTEFDLPKDKSPPTVTVHPNAPLPKLSQAWSWAHGQIAGYKSLASGNAADLQTLQDQLTNHSENLVARLICPRRLKDSPHTPHSPCPCSRAERKPAWARRPTTASMGCRRAGATQMRRRGTIR
jgi:hypothetical protein